MNISLTRNSELPPMSWLMRLVVGRDPGIDLLAGDHVEVFPNGWVEGAWSGDFGEFDLGHAYLAGTGGSINGSQVTLYPPFHSCHSVVLARTADSILASNSLALLVASSGLRIPKSRSGPFYPTLLDRLTHGIDAHEIRLPTDSDVDIQVVSIRPASLDARTGEFQFLAPHSEADFSDYEGCVRFLMEVSRAVCENARDSRRRNTYLPAALLSKGYDAPAAAVIAQHCGADLALSLKRSQGAFDESHIDDSGVEIGRALGLPVKEFDRDTRLVREGAPVVDEFWATGFPTGDIVYLSMEDDVRGRVLFSGQSGDAVWAKGARLSRPFQRGDLMGNSLSELFRRTSTVFFPLTFLLAGRQDDVEAIGRAPEMAAWSVGGTYDRPIPRRLVEEAGVPRTSFGMKKSAAGARGLALAEGDQELYDLLEPEYRALLPEPTFPARSLLLKSTLVGHAKNAAVKWLPRVLLNQIRQRRKYRSRMAAPYVTMPLQAIGTQSAQTQLSRHVFTAWGIDRLAKCRYGPAVTNWMTESTEVRG